MRVENLELNRYGEVYCIDCPLLVSRVMCEQWRDDHMGQCPDCKTYQSACLMAEEAAKGGKG